MVIRCITDKMPTYLWSVWTSSNSNACLLMLFSLLRLPSSDSFFANQALILYLWKKTNRQVKCSLAPSPFQSIEIELAWLVFCVIFYVARSSKGIKDIKSDVFDVVQSYRIVWISVRYASSIKISEWGVNCELSICEVHWIAFIRIPCIAFFTLPFHFTKLKQRLIDFSN